MDGSSPVSVVNPQADGRYAVQLKGIFAPDWTGAFCAALGSRKINVERGFAKQVQPGSWEACFTLRALEPAVDLSKLDYRQLASERADLGTLHHERHPLRSFIVQEKADAIAVSLVAPDSLGLLGKILGTVSMLMLYAYDMKIETSRGEAHDSFLLKGFAGARPGTALRTRLRATLQTLCKTDAGGPG